MTRQHIIAAIVGLILVTSLGIGGFPPVIALAITLIGATVILMMAWAGWPGWPWEGGSGIMLRDAATDWTGELGALINLAQLRRRGYSKSRRSSPVVACAMAPRHRCAGGCGRGQSEI